MTQVSISGLAPHKGDEGDQETQVKLSCAGQIHIAQSYTSYCTCITSTVVYNVWTGGEWKVGDWDVGEWEGGEWEVGEWEVGEWEVGKWGLETSCGFGAPTVQVQSPWAP